MLDRESIDKDQVQQHQASERYEAVDTISRVSKDQVFFSEPRQESDHLTEYELYWDEELEFAVEVSVDNEKSYQPTHYFKKKMNRRINL